MTAEELQTVPSQVAQRTAPAALPEPRVHGAHAADPGEDERLPGGQGAQAEELLAPVMPLYEPAAQGRHAELLLLPVLGL